MAHIYRKTISACYTGTFVQAIILNVTPILFVSLIDLYSLNFEQMGRLVLINFVTQFAADLLFAKPIDRFGIRPFAVGAQLCAALGLVLFGLSPFLFGKYAYFGLMLGTAVFSAGGGVIELVLNQVISGIPGEEKAGMLNIMHSFYAWGYILVVLVTTGIILLFGNEKWFIAPVIWAILPVVNSFRFTRVMLPPAASADTRMPMKKLLSRRFFTICVFAMLVCGSIEVIMGQWASTFLETAIGLPKLTGDILGVCMFACMMGVGRAICGRMKARLNICAAMMLGSVLCALCYLAAGLSGSGVVCLLACALCGLGVSMMWPGCVSVAAEQYPLAGAGMFALLSGAARVTRALHLARGQLALLRIKQRAACSLVCCSQRRFRC